MKLGMYSKKAYAIAYSGARVARLSEGALNYVITNKRLRIGTKALAMQNEKGNTGSMCEAGWNTLDLQI